MPIPHQEMRQTRSLFRFYLYAVVNGLQFTFTTWLAYVLVHGGNPGWAEGFYHLAIWLGEVPTGIIADLIGRRTSMLVGLVLGALTSLGWFWIHDTFTACVVMALSGLAGSFLSGADTALLYETAQAVGGAELAQRAIARTTALRMAGLAVSPFLGGLLYSWHDWAPTVARAVVALAGLLVVWGMTEQRKMHAAATRPSMWGQAKAGARVVLHNRSILYLMLLGWCWYTASSMASQYGQAYFPYTGLSRIITGAIFSVAMLVSTGGSALAERLSPRAGNLLLRYAPMGVALGIFSMGLGAGWLGAACFIGGEFISGLMDPVFNYRFNQAIPDAQRATVLSLQNAGVSMLMAIAFPAASYLQPVTHIYVAVGAVSVLLAGIWLRPRYQRAVVVLE